MHPGTPSPTQLPALTYEYLRTIYDSVGELRGWDFSRMRARRDPVPWDYVDVARRYLTRAAHVLDVGTGGGETFLRLAPHFGSGIGADPNPNMLRVARENAAAAEAAGLPRGRVSFERMPKDALPFADESFDVVLLRHAPVLIEELVRVLRPGGYFVTQGVGGNNMRSICRVFGVTAYGEPLPGPPPGDPEPHHGVEVGQSFQVPVHQGKQGQRSVSATVVARAEYDVRYFVLDVESLVFWLKALGHLAPGRFDIGRHWRQVARVVSENWTAEGIETNEHRDLLVVRRE